MEALMVKLYVNIDHVATVRQARMIDEPDPVWGASLAELGGADGITFHLREDRRHITDRDLPLLKETVKTPLNMEMAATEEMTKIARKLKPHHVTLVPEKRREVTTEGGLDVAKEKTRIKRVVQRLKDADIITSLFIAPDIRQLEASRDVGTDFVELHTGAYANAKGEREIRETYFELYLGAIFAHNLGIRVNAGHGLNYRNTGPVACLPHMEELNIGHSIVARAVFVGMERAVREMKDLITNPSADF